MAPTGGRRSSTTNANTSPTSDRQVAASNSTLKAWAGRNQPSWLTNAKPVKPTPRPPPSKQLSISTEITETPQTTQVQATQPTQTQTTRPVNTTEPASAIVSAPASTPSPLRSHDPAPPKPPVQVQTSTSISTSHTVLPSPAPSDEPSPSVPKPQNPISTTEAHFVLDTTLDDLPEPSTVLTRTSSVSTTPRTSTPTNMVLNTPPTPNLPTCNPNVGHQEHRGQPPAKRRRAGTPYSEFLQSLRASQTIRSRVSSLGGGQNLLEHVERPRYQLLTDACDEGDLFFVALHQLFCAWSISPIDVHRLCDGGEYQLCDGKVHHPSLVDNAFGIMGTHLKSNSKLRAEHLRWFVAFPASLGSLQAHLIYRAVLKQVLDFLMCISHRWQMAHHSHAASGYPFLMTELLDTFSLFSPILQSIMFRASRRSLGIIDGHYATQMEALFRTDQKNHMNPDGSFQRCCSSALEYQKYNQSFIEKYRQITMQSQASNGVRQTSQQSVPTTPPIIQQPVSYPPHMDPQVNHQMQLNPDQGPRFQPGPAPTPSMSPVDEAARMQFPHPQSLAGTPLGAPSPIPATNSPFLRAPVLPQFTLPSQNMPNNLGAATPLPSTFTPASAQFLPQQYQHQQGPERRVSQQGMYTAPASPQPFNQQQYPQLQLQPRQPQAVPNFNGHPQMLPRGISYAEGQGHNNGGAVPMAGAINTPLTPQPVYTMNNTQGHIYPMNFQAQPEGIPREERLIPLPGERINIRDYPHDPQDIRSVHSTLHQAHLRSPKRMPRELHRPIQRFYQAVKGFPIAPVATPPQQLLHKFKFTISALDYVNITRDENIRGEPLPVNRYGSGSMRVRIRCCYKKKSESAASSFSPSDWAVTDTQWPEHIFLDLNGATLSVRRKQHYSKDLPIEVSSFVLPSDNWLSIYIVPGGYAPPNQEPYIAIELVEILSHSDVLQMVHAHGTEPATKTREIIRRRLAGSSGGSLEDDELALANDDLSIDLADPFSMSIFKTPVRGSSCTHLECFDLETWLNTRLGKKCCRCNNSASCPNCAKEPSFVDKWKCPLCGSDARPYSLRIDEYLVEVRSRLESEDKLRTKSILVSPDGTWRPKEEPIDDSDIDSDDDGPPIKTSRPGTAAPQREKPPIQVIELDDD